MGVRDVAISGEWMVMKSLIEWLTACWYCETCTWFMLLVSVVSCVIRAAIVIAILYAIATWGMGALSEVGNTLGVSA